MIVREQAEDVGDLVLAAFGRAEVATLADALAASDAHLVSLVAEDDGAVVGHVQLSRGWLDAPERLVGVAVGSPLSVLPARQREGVGGLLVRAGLRWAEDAGLPAVFLEGAPGYYARFGFRPGGEIGCTPPSVRIPPPGFQVVTLPAWRPAMAGALVYPDPFWRLDCVGLR